MGSAWALLGEAPGTAALAGAALLVAGVLIAQNVIRFPRPGRADQTAPGEPAGEVLPAAAASRDQVASGR
jgi:hypothetical protein